jgi:hypothetical protein
LWAIWSGVSFTIARRLFLRLELVPGKQGRIGGNLSLPDFLDLAISPRISDWMGSLGSNLQIVLKEFRLQGSSLVFLSAILLNWIVLWGLSFMADLPVGGDYHLWEIIDPLNCFFILPCMVWVLPVLVGATAMARERQIGVVDWHFSLPKARFKQWCIKLGVAVFIAVGCGALLGSVLALELTRRLSEFNCFSKNLSGNLLYYLLGTPLFFGFPLYASSLLKDPLKAVLGGAVLLGATLLLLFTSTTLSKWFGFRTWTGIFSPGAIFVCVVPFSMVLLLSFTYWNFRPYGFAARRFAVQMAVWFGWVSLPVFLLWVL